jgi:hypothetical protein
VQLRGRRERKDQAEVQRNLTQGQADYVDARPIVKVRERPRIAILKPVIKVVPRPHCAGSGPLPCRICASTCCN